MKAIRLISVILFAGAFITYIVFQIGEKQALDFTAPVIFAPSDVLEAPVDVTDADLLQGMTASDNLNGDVTDTLLVTAHSKFISKGVVRVTYAAFDENNNVGTYVRELHYTDYVSPHFVLHEPLLFLNSGEKDITQIYQKIGATDCLDGDISGQVILTMAETPVMDGLVELRKLNIQVSNRGGDTSTLELDVRYADYAAYNLQSPGLADYILYTKKDKMPDFSQNIAGIRSGTSLIALDDSAFSSNDISIDTSSLDVHTPGAYTVVYSLSRKTDGTEERLGSAFLVVVVEEE